MDTLTNPLEPQVVQIARKILQLGCFFNCAPYQLVRNEPSVVSGLTIQLQAVPRLKCILTQILFWLYVAASWVVVIVRTATSQTGSLDLGSRIHLTFVAFHSVTLLFSLTATFLPDAML